MFVVMSKFTVDNKDKMTPSVKNAFVNRPHLVENATGFVRLDVLSPVENSDEIWLLTYWTDQPCFQAWYRTHHYKEVHANIPVGLQLINDRTQLLFFEHISS